mmetsp:Transcript_95053/g.212407  ORF Transcript_95053/g.212407 Transcript_95053/m.212407 type:complete len:159 (-) Transcript_95053:71-547(-)
MAAIAATWSQTDDLVTVTVPLPPQEEGVALRPEVTIRPQHLTVRSPAVASTDGGGEAQATLLDNDLSGDVAVEGSAWTVDACTLVVELAKKPDYGSGADGSGSQRASWWPCLVRGGKKGPEDPKAPPKPKPNVQRLDSKIGEQAESKKSFQGNSKFQW